MYILEYTWHKGITQDNYKAYFIGNWSMSEEYSSIYKSPTKQWVKLIKQLISISTRKQNISQKQ